MLMGGPLCLLGMVVVPVAIIRQGSKPCCINTCCYLPILLLDVECCRYCSGFYKGMLSVLLAHHSGISTL
jgi:hypothetical protein